VLRKSQADLEKLEDQFDNIEGQQTMTKISAIFDVTEARLQKNLCFDRETIQ